MSVGINAAFTHQWYWKSHLPDRKGQRCRVLARGGLNSILVEFPDGLKVVTSWYAVRAMDRPAAERVVPSE